MFRVNESAGAAALLRLGDRMQCQGGLARTLRPIHLDDPAARQAADAKGDVQPQRAGRDDLDLLVPGAGAHAHDGALAERAFDLRDRRLQRLVLVCHETSLSCLPNRALNLAAKPNGSFRSRRVFALCHRCEQSRNPGVQLIS